MRIDADGTVATRPLYTPTKLLYTKQQPARPPTRPTHRSRHHHATEPARLEARQALAAAALVAKAVRARRAGGAAGGLQIDRAPKAGLASVAVRLFGRREQQGGRRAAGALHAGRRPEQALEVPLRARLDAAACGAVARPAGGDDAILGAVRAGDRARGVPAVGRVAPLPAERAGAVVAAGVVVPVVALDGLPLVPPEPALHEALQRAGAGGGDRGGVLRALAALDVNQAVGGGVAAPGPRGALGAGEGEAVGRAGGVVAGGDDALIWAGGAGAGGGD